MAALTFAQPARRNLATPIIAALVVFGIALALVLIFTPHKTADVSIKKTAVYPTHIVFKTDTHLVGRDTAEDNLYVLVTLHIEDRLRLPLFLKDFNATLTPADSDPITTSAVERPDLPNLYASFPEIKSLVDQNSPPLFRETQIDPGKSAEGLLLLHFPVSQATWDQRESAALTIDLYHQSSITIELPK